MAYVTIETALAAIIRKIKGYDAGNVVSDDYLILSKGKSKRAVVLRRGPAALEELTMGNPHNVENIWTTDCELFVASSPRASKLAADIITEGQKILDEVRKWPQLDSTSGVVTVDIDIFDEPEEGNFGGGRARSKWWRQVIEVLVVEIEAVTRSE